MSKVLFYQLYDHNGDHPPVKLRTEVGSFALAMEKRLQENEHKGHWDKLTVNYILARIDRHKWNLLHSPTVDDVTENAVDMANYLMMLADQVQKEGTLPQKDTP